MSIFSYFRSDSADDNAISSQYAPDIQRLLSYTTSPSLGPEGPWPASSNMSQYHAYANAPLFSVAAQALAEKASQQQSTGHHLVPQYGLIGSREDVKDQTPTPEDQLIMANLNIPWSAFICGSQGSGKSHTLSCLLEACLIQDNPTATLSHPMAGLVFHYDNFTSGSTTQICEAAHLSSSGITVKVLVPPSNIWNMDRAYRAHLEDTHDCPNLQVVPLYLDESRLNVSTMLKLMAFDPNGSVTPLYMEVVMRIIREITMEGNPFTYSLFRTRLAGTKLLPGQKTPLQMRLQLLETFLTPELTPHMRKPSAAEQDIWDFRPGTLTVVDLSDPFLSSDDACGLFSICLSIFLQERTNCGRVVALDEAHKFLTQSGAAAALTEDLISVVRQQRHISTRVFTATQEPTLSPKLIDLSNATFIHRFSSPAWFHALENHLAGITPNDKGASAKQQYDVFRSMTELRTGEALVFCPTAQIRAAGDKTAAHTQSLGFQSMRIRIRKRITFDGGVSLAATAELSLPRLTDPTRDQIIRMYEPVARSPTMQASRHNRSSTNGMLQHDNTVPSRNGSVNPGPGAEISPLLESVLASNHHAPDTGTSSSLPIRQVELVSSNQPQTTQTGQAEPASSAKIIVSTKQQLNALAIQYFREIARDESWDQATTLNKSAVKIHLEAFSETIELSSSLRKAPKLKSRFHSALTTVLAEIRQPAPLTPR